MSKIWYKILLFLYVFTGIFADFIANDKPVICLDANGRILTVWHKDYDMAYNRGCKALVYPLVHYSYKTIDKDNASFVSPFGKQNLKPGQQRHFLGTDKLGRDVLAGIIHGANISLKTGVLSMLLALIFALAMGLYPAYYGDDGVRLSAGRIIALVLWLAMAVYLLTYAGYWKYAGSGKVVLILVIWGLILWFFKAILDRYVFKDKKIALPLDSMVTLFTKLFKSLPAILLVLVLVSMFAKPSIYNIILVIAIIQWPVLTRHIRAGVLDVKKELFIQSSKALGLPDYIILWRHILPHILTPVLVALSFGFAGTILLESTLSFLGIGLPPGHVSWGTLLSEARQNYAAWWLAVFPGLAIFITIMLFKRQLLGQNFWNKNNPSTDV